MGYVRFSTDKQASTAEQMAAIEKYCRAHAIDLIGFRVDEGQTGTNTNREGFQRLVREAKSKKFDCVIVYDITRGSRDVADWFTFRKEMQMLGIQVFSTMDNLGRVDDPNAFLTELLAVGIGQHMVLVTRIKSMDKIAMLAAEGKFCGGYAPLGYRIENGNYVIDEYEARAVRQIYAMYAGGKSYQDIIRWLAAEGYKGKRGRPIGKNSLFEILRNERYIGIYSWNKRQMKYMSKWAGGKPREDAVVIPDAIPRIIDSKTWEKVRARMENNKVNTQNKSKAGRDYLLSGLLRCAKCGAAFTGRTTTNKKGVEYKFYTCSGKKRLHNCDAKNIAANDIEPLLVNLLKDALTNGTLIEKTAEAILERTSGHNSNIAQLKEELVSVGMKIDKLLDSLEEGLDSPSLRERLQENEAKKKALEEELKSLESTHTLTKEDLVASMQEDARRAMEDPSCMKELLRKYFTCVEIGDEEITIHAVCDLGDAQKKEQLPEKISESCIRNGCGGPVCVVVQYRFPRPKRRISNQPVA